MPTMPESSSVFASTIQSGLTEQELLPHLVKNHLNWGHSISLWRLPDSDEKNLLVSTEGVKFLDEVNLEESPTGFVFSPFNRNNAKLFLKGDLIFTFKKGELYQDGKTTADPLDLIKKEEASLPKRSPYYFKQAIDTSAAGKSDFVKLVAQSIIEIQKGTFEKIVPSRRQSFSLPENFDPLVTFQKLCDSYPHAFVSLVSTPESGTWIGATPELLVSIDANMKFKTVAVAGTKVFEQGTDLKSVSWKQKDIEEQALVCRYIIGCFKKIRLREYEEHGPRTAVAGNLMHLKTDFEVDMVATNFPLLGSVMLELLHPTSAVCGMPLDSSVNFLQRHEGYDREFYSGYLGPVNFKNGSNIFVNIRCMQVQKNQAWCYAGAGITIDSDPEQEWTETEMKMNTLLRVLNS